MMLSRRSSRLIAPVLAFCFTPSSLLAQPAEAEPPPEVPVAPPPEPPPAEAPAPAEAEAPPAPPLTELPTDPGAAAPEPPPAPLAAEPMELPEPEAPPPPPAPEFLPLKVSGSIWSRYELREGYAEHALAHPRLHREGDYIVSRARLGLATNPVDVGGGTKVSGTFVPQAAYTWGTTGTPVTISDGPPLSIYEGYASVGNEHYKFDAGRFMMDYGDALVIGNLGWNEAARAFNGARVRLTPSSTPFWIDGFATLITEGRALTLEPISGDTYFYGVYAALGPAIAEGFDLDVYLLGQTLGSYEDAPDPTDPMVALTRESATEFTLGTRVKGSVSMLDYRVEAGVQFGKVTGEPTTMAPTPAAVDKSAFQVDGELGVTPVKGLRFAAGGFFASGDDLSSTDANEGWNELYPTGHKWLGLADVVGPRTNVAGPTIGVKYSGLESLVFSADFLNFSRLETDASGVDGSMGSELDFNLIHPIGKGAVVRAMYAIFLPSEDFWTPKVADPEVAGDPIHYLEVQFGYDFK